MMGARKTGEMIFRFSIIIAAISWCVDCYIEDLCPNCNLYQDSAEVRSHCAYPCQCANRDPVCEPGVPHTRDGCGCCPVCARQDGDPCDGIAVCDQRKGLVCQYDDYYSPAGICRVVKGLPCTVYNKTYDNGETFRLDCRTQCTCQNGTYACASLCPQENISPQGLCRHPRLVEVPGQCCREWMCDNVNMERPPNCEALVTPWAECSSQCGLGLSRRVSNANEACKPNNETRLCQIRPCHSPPLVNAKYARHHHIRKGHECKATIKSTTPVRLKFGDCRSRKTFHPKRCGGACPSTSGGGGGGNSGIVCAPELSTTVKVEFLCRSPVEGHDRLDGAVPGDDLWEPVHRPFSATADDYVHSVYVDVEWIVKCTCRRHAD
ncbi:hypothetical protein ACI65C_003470 [Semiaphis heraclei]